MDALAALDKEQLSQYLARTTKSKALYERAVKVMPGGDTRTGTFHLPYPLFISRGQGTRIWDADGNEYLDFLNNFTSLLHGHAHPEVHQALVTQGTQGTVHGSANELQIELAEIICGRVPSVERIRFCNSGTEATMGALRGAKAFTGKTKIMKMEGGYHGSHDQVSVAMAPPYNTNASQGLSPGALSEVLLGFYNDLDRTAEVIRKNKSDLAAVIVEPMMGAGGGIVARAEFLKGLRQLTEECGVLLVFDEIITFRLETGGVQQRHGIKPDLTCFGKIIGGGLPIGAFGGRADIMATFDPTRPGAIVHSGTYNGNAATMAAGIRTLQLYTPQVVAQLNALGDGLRTRLQGILDKSGVEATMAGTGSLMQLHFASGPIQNPYDANRADRAALRAMHISLLNRGIFAPSRQMYVMSTAMTQATVDTMARHFEQALAPIAERMGRPETAGAR